MKIPVYNLITLLFVVIYSDAGHSETNVTVVFPSLPSTVLRTCHVPDNLEVYIRMPTEHISLSLIRNMDVDENAPVFLMRKSPDGSPNFIKHTSKGSKTLLYQDTDNRAEFEVTCNKDGRTESPLILNGTLELTEGRTYSLQKSAVEDSNVYILKEEILDQQFTEAIGFDDVGRHFTKITGTRTDSRTRTKTRWPRSTRSAPSKDDLFDRDVYIDVMALIENSVYKRWSSRSADPITDLKQYFAHVFNGVNLRFKTASSQIHVNLVGFIIEDTENGEWFQRVLDKETDKNYVNVHVLLQSMSNLSKTANFPHNDHLISFTDLDIYVDEYTDNVVGYAYIGQVCMLHGASVSTVQYGDFFIGEVYVTAHEIGHSLGALHDNESGENGNTCDTTHIMSAGSFTFSSCSRDYFYEYINQILTNGSEEAIKCFDRLQPDSVPNVTDETLPGQLLHPDEHCLRLYGPGSFAWRRDRMNLTINCVDVGCYNANDTLFYGGLHVSRGTTCGDRMWCDAGHCVYSPKAPAADPKCIFGDQPVFPDGETCQDKVTSNSSCTDIEIGFSCCDTCKELKCNLQCHNKGFVNSTTCQCVCQKNFAGTSCEKCKRRCQNGGEQSSSCKCTCLSGYSGDWCEIGNETTTTTADVDAQSSSLSTPALIGIISGSVVLVFLITGIAVFIYRRRQTASSQMT